MKFAGWITCLACLPLITLAQAAETLSANEAAAWLQKIANASRQTPYEGFFVFQQGGGTQSVSQTLLVSNRPAPAASGTTTNRLLALDGSQREVRCTQSASVTLMVNGNQLQLEKRLNKRHFPDLLPANAGVLANWYAVRLGSNDEVAGKDCTNIELIPKDAYRWGYVMCVDKSSSFPLRAALTNADGQALMQYRFAEIKLGAPPKMDDKPTPSVPEVARPIASERVSINGLPPGFSRIAAVRRQLPNRSGEVEHWVFSDGLTHVSLFLEPLIGNAESVRGQSKQGLVNLFKRPVGNLQATVLGEAPMATVEAMAMGLEAKP